jgi:fermentation-respiration switch protein FrsA (DUF1100 family)
MLRIFVLAGVVLALYAFYCALLYGQQRTMMFPGTGIAAPDPPVLPPGLVATRLETPQGDVEAWFLPPASPPGPAVVFAHGNFELIDHATDVIDGFRALGVGVLLVEYPGYGRSAGTPSLASLDAALEQAYDWLATRPGVDASRIHAMGRSVGTGVAARLALRRPVAGLVLQSPFTRIADFAKRMLVPPFLVRDPFDNLDAVARYAGPVLVMHGRHDDVIPFAHGVAVARASPNATFVPLDCAHNDCPRDERAYWRAIGDFMSRRAIAAKPE